MTSKKNKRSLRPRYPEDEAKYPWLRRLLEAYHISDDGTRTLVEAESKRRNEPVACQKGCYACCIRESYPVSPLELFGISWYVNERLDEAARAAVLHRMATFAPPASCPLLDGGVCAIYPMRPLSCRTFYRFGEPCRGETTETTQQDADWLKSSEHRDLARRVSLEMLPFYGIARHNERIKAFNDGYMLAVTQSMHEVDWKAVATGQLHRGEPRAARVQQ